MQAFLSRLQNGFKLLFEGLTEQGLPAPTVAPERLALFDNSEALADKLRLGATIAELLGFTPEQLEQFYAISTKFIEKGDYLSGKDLLHVLTILAPNQPPFWVGLGLCHAKLSQFKAACKAYQTGLEFGPENSDVYLGYMHGLIKSGKYDEALALCEKGIHFALQYHGEAWAEKLGSILEEAHRVISQLAPHDPEFEAALKKLIDAVLEKEKGEFRRGLEPFSFRADKIRLTLSDTMHTLKKSYTQGYQAICEALERQAVMPPPVSSANLDPEMVQKGKALYELLGYTPETMIQFYNAACRILEEKQVDKACDAFYFLVTIAPEIADFWLGLSLARTELKEYKAALDAALHAIQLDPKKADAYLIAMRLCHLLQAADEAQQLYNQGVAFANQRRDEPWAKELLSVLEETYRYFNEHLQKVKTL